MMTNETLQKRVKFHRFKKQFDSDLYTLRNKLREEIYELDDELSSKDKFWIKENFRDELADVFIILIAICNRYNISMEDIILDKMEKW